MTLVCWLLSVLGIALVGLLGTSAAVPPLPGSSHWPPYALSLHPADGLVFAIQGVATLAGAAATWRMLSALRNGWAPDPRRMLAVGLLVAGAFVLLPPVASADIKSYIAYGQEDVLGVNPYTHGPQSAGVPQDPITQSVESPWQRTPSIYGPVFTKISSGIADVANGDAHLAVTLTRILLVAGFAVTAVVLHVIAGDAARRRRAAVLWTVNPLLLYTLVAGAHLDALVAATTVCTMALLRRLPLLAGAVVGLAATLKLTGLVVLPGALWATRRRRRSAAAVVVGGLVFAVPWFAATSGAFTQLRHASRFATPAAPWRAVSSLIQPALGYSTSRSLVGLLAGLVGLTLVALMLRRGLPEAPDTTLGRAAGVTSTFALGWVLSASYILPWYDALAWAPLALVGASFLDRVLLVHTAVLIFAFLPGRDIPLSTGADIANRVLHSGVSPVMLAALMVLTGWLLVRPDDAGGPSPVPGRARE